MFSSHVREEGRDDEYAFHLLKYCAFNYSCFTLKINSNSESIEELLEINYESVEAIVLSSSPLHRLPSHLADAFSIALN